MLSFRGCFLNSLKIANATLVNSQMKYLILSVLGRLYSEADFEQSEKVLASGYLIANKAENHLFSLASGTLLAGKNISFVSEAFKKNDKIEKMNHQMALNEMHREKLEAMFKTPCEEDNKPFN